MKISERSLEEAIESALLSEERGVLTANVEAFRMAAPYGEGAPGGYERRRPEEYDRALCLIPRDVLDFIYATQPREWERLKQHYGDEVKERFLRRLAGEIERRGTLDVLRKGIKDSGCKFELAYFRPSSGLNEELQKRYQANQFSVVRQLRYSTKNEKSLDVVLSLNGIPIFTAELKNPLTGQTVEDAIRQYKLDRDPREPLFAFGRCLAHFAVDPDLVYVATHLEVEEEDEKGRKTGERRVIFPRYHQLDAVRRLVDHARANGPGQRYLVQHSAGSGKSNSIAWLAHQLSVLHDAQDRRVFDSIIVITDRRVLDRQIQRTVWAFEQTPGVVENIDKTSRQLKEALESGKTIIVTTLQKFPVIADEIGALPQKRFAVIIDEAHSSQSGEDARSLKKVLAAGSLEEAEREEGGEGEDLEDRIVAEMTARGHLPNAAISPLPQRPSPRPWSCSVPDGLTGSSRPSASTRCARPSRRGSSWTSWSTTPPTRSTGSSSRKSPTTPTTTGTRPATSSAPSWTSTSTRSGRRSRSWSSTSMARSRAGLTAEPRP